MNKLLKPEEVAALLQVSVRKLRELEIPYSRIGRLKRYDARDVEAFRRENLQCRSTNAQTRPTSGRNLSSKGTGFAEALKQRPAAKPSNSSEGYASKSKTNSRTLRPVAN